MRTPLLLLSMTTLALVACKQAPTVPNAVSGIAYKIDIQQGNAITQEMVAKLRAGMTQAQVRYILGTPLVTDPFHPERWDYVYTFAKHGTLTERRRLTVIFADNKLTRLEGDVLLDDSSLQAGQTGPSGPDSVTNGVPVTLSPAPTGVPIDSAPPVTGTVPAMPAAPTASANAPAAGAVTTPAAAAPAATPVATTPATTTSTGAASSGATPATATPAADPAQSNAPKKADDKGFFGKIMDKIGL